jgi:hypothetical protein
MATKEASAGPSFGDSYATAAVVRARYSLSAEQSWEGFATAFREEQARAAVAAAVAKV